MILKALSLPSLGATDPYILLPTTVLIQLGRSAYAPARMEIMDDVINMTRLRGRADPGQLAPIQIMTVADPDGTGTPISAWAGRGSSGGQGISDNMATGVDATTPQGARPPRPHTTDNTQCFMVWGPPWLHRHPIRRVAGRIICQTLITGTLHL